jgi:hypothetical protein
VAGFPFADTEPFCLASETPTRQDSQNSGLNPDTAIRVMNTSPNGNSRKYKLSFIINTIVGGIILLLAIAAGVCESLHLSLRGQLVWGFVPATMICWFIASLHYSKYLSLSR